MDTLTKEPDGLEYAPFRFSNFDHEMPAGADALLRAGKHTMEHTAWDHYGIIWFADRQFHERVMCYGTHVATISADSLLDLVSEVNDQYGHD